MITESAMKKYISMVRSNVFIEYEKEFAQRISFALSKGYLQKQRENQLVQTVEDVVNSLQNLPRDNHRVGFKLSTKAVFIHGTKSQVEFDYYGQTTQRELGDLVFIISIFYKGKKFFEKLTINQFKRSKEKAYWYFNKKDKNGKHPDKEQLYFLSRFPTFKGVKGLIPKKDFNLPNYSGCLGSYGLLYKPGDFASVSATDIDSFIGHRNSLKMSDLYNLSYETEKHSCPYFTWYDFFCFHPSVLPCNLFSNYHYAHNVFDFAHKYLTVGIGEPIFMEIGMDNSQVRNFLHELLSAVRIKARGKQDILDFIKRVVGGERESDFREETKFDFEGGGIGMVHTIIDLGE